MRKPCAKLGLKNHVTDVYFLLFVTLSHVHVYVLMFPIYLKMKLNSVYNPSHIRWRCCVGTNVHRTSRKQFLGLHKYCKGTVKFQKFVLKAFDNTWGKYFLNVVAVIDWFAGNKLK